MVDSKNIKSEFLAEREKLFNNKVLAKNSFKFCVRHSLLVEEYILRLTHNAGSDCVLAAAGSFSRRELSPFSGIDIIFIFPNLDQRKKDVQSCMTKFLDAGIDVSHTVRQFSDIKKFMNEDLQTFTKFFETRFIYGDKKIYDEWNKKLFDEIENTDKEKFIFELFEDVEDRYKTFGHSPKILEPNVKFTAGGLRDIHTVEWLHSIKNKQILSQQYEVTHTERFIEILFQDKLVNYKAKKRLLDGYKLILQTRNLLHLTEGRKTDRLEFSNQKNIALKIGYDESTWKDFMFKYFESGTIINRFSKTMMKRYRQEIAFPLSDYLNIKLDDDFNVKGKILTFSADRYLSISEIMRAFFYRAVNDASFEKNLRALVIESTHIYEETEQAQTPSSVFFREMLKLPSNVGKTLSVMNEFGFLGIFLKEFGDLVGFFQPGVYHCYTADEHSLIALQNVELLNEQNNNLSRIFKYLPAKDVLYMAILLHDIGKPISVSGHEIIGAEISISVMDRLGFGQKEIDMVKFLVKHHLRMEKVAFKRNLNDPETLDKFVKLFPSVEHLDLLYLLTYADLSAVSPVIWTQWKEDLLNELYTKTKLMLEAQLSGEELIYSKSLENIESKNLSEDASLVEYFEQLDDESYRSNFSQDEIDLHLQEFEKDSKFAVFIKNTNNFTNVTVVAKDSDSLLSSLCGMLSINELYIHDAKVFTRKNNYVINSFNVTDFNNHEIISETNHNKIERSLLKIIDNKVQFEKEFEIANEKWKKIEKLKYESEPNVKFEDHERFTIIDVHSYDRVGLLYQLTHKMVEIGLTVYFAKISTKVEEVVDTFYVLKNDGKKILKSEFEFIKAELLGAIS